MTARIQVSNQPKPTTAEDVANRILDDHPELVDKWLLRHPPSTSPTSVRTKKDNK